MNKDGGAEGMTAGIILGRDSLAHLIHYVLRLFEIK